MKNEPGISTLESAQSLRMLDQVHAYQDALQSQADARASEIAACREAVAGIKSIPGWAKSEYAYAHLLAVISAEIAKSGFGHTEQAERVCNELNDLHDDLNDGPAPVDAARRAGL